jgi:cytochrome P450
MQIPSLLFSGGPRGCLGKSLALVEMKVFMIKLMKRYAKVEELGLKERAFCFALTNGFKNS